MPKRASKRESSPGKAKTARRGSTPPANSPAAAEAYRGMALALPDAVESSHMGAADFRVNGKIFATLAYAAKGLGTVKLNSEQQAGCLADAPEYFTPAPGGWGRNGTSLVRLDAPEDVLRGALSMAHRNVLKECIKPARRRTAGT